MTFLSQARREISTVQNSGLFFDESFRPKGFDGGPSKETELNTDEGEQHEDETCIAVGGFSGGPCLAR